MARGYFRTDNTICVFCGHSDYDENGYRKPLQHKTGSKNNPAYLCDKCWENNKKFEKDSQTEVQKGQSR